MLSYKVQEYLRERAYFVSGLYPEQRSKNDPIVESAIGDAASFLKSISGLARDPMISGGTSSSRQNIISLYWIEESQNRIKVLTIHFFGLGECSIRWDGPDNRTYEWSRTSISELQNIDVAGKIQGLRGQSVRLTPREPRPH